MPEGRTSDIPCDLIVDEPLSGQENMDRDEAMLARAVSGVNRCMVRIYRWQTPTVSLGYFQSDQSAVDPRLATCPQVKRLSGGGAILHDVELTYSCVLPDTHSVRHAPLSLYGTVHTELIRLLSECGVQSTMRMDADSGGLIADPKEPFLCFLRHDDRDIVTAGTKIVGSAQRRRRGHILQHGSILLAASQLVPEVHGIRDLCPEFDEQRFTAGLPLAVAGAVSQNVEPCSWSDVAKSLNS